MLASCSSNLERNYLGFWEMKLFSFKGEKIEYFTSNGVFFRKNQTCGLPITHITQQKEGEWRLVDKGEKKILRVEAGDNPFTGEYIFSFNKREGRPMLTLIGGGKRIVLAKVISL